MTFPYFGRKSKIAGQYPAPLPGVPVIEPFAGSMAYTLHWRPERALGFERDARVADLWHRLSLLDAVPNPPVKGSSTDDLLVKLCSYSEHSLTSGKMTVTSRMLRDWESIHRRALADGPYMRENVLYSQGDYRDAGDVEATWFIDPPYQKANRRGYRYGAAHLDYGELASWCLARKGLVIVCEQEGADWLPFQRFTDLVSHRGSRTVEVWWTNTWGAES
jgi:site-specific DNA-adenine methylase